MFKKILEQQNKNTILLLHLNITKQGTKYETPKFTRDKITKIKQKLAKFSPQIFDVNQTEYFYKNLTKVEINNVSHAIKKEISHILFETALLAITKIIPIDSHQYPPLSIPHHASTKSIQVYKINNIEILLISQNDQTTIALDLSNATSSDESNFAKLISVCV